MAITFRELGLTLSILKVPYALLLAGIVAIIDALPILGTGTVLLHWALVALITGNGALALGLVLTYGTVSLVRSVLEPKLVGQGISLHPVATLLAMYVGFSACGVLGMVLFPIALPDDGKTM